MKWLILFFSCISTLFASTAVTENDPSTLVNNVSVITGDFFTFQTDYEVQGAQPIRLQRTYLSSVGTQVPPHHLIATYSMLNNRFDVFEPNGTYLPYLCVEPKKMGKRKETIRFNAAILNIPGVTNTASDVISAHTNLKNQYMFLAPGGQSFVLYTSNGTKRYYRAISGQEPVDVGFGNKMHVFYHYVLDVEELPNGNKLQYHWSDNHCFLGVTALSCRNQVLNSITLPHVDPKRPPLEYRMSGSDGRFISYNAEYLDAEKKRFYLKSIDLPDAPRESFEFEIKNNIPLLKSIALPNGKALQVEYEDASPHPRVKKLLRPIGKDDKFYVLNTFNYYPDQRKTDVFDADGNKTTYFWNDALRLTRIEYCIQSDQLHHSEQFAWDGTNLRSKTHLDAQGNRVHSREFVYDDRGNVKEEIFVGNLTGTERADEKCVKKIDYTNDGKNLPIRQEDVSGLITLFTYVPNTNLLKTKSLCDGATPKITYTYDYDDDLFLIQETIDDGISKTIKKITPKKDLPYRGMPEIIEEPFFKKTVLTYGAGGRVEKRDVFDADGIFCYSLITQYDDKGHPVFETNPLGWEATAKYNSAGNKEHSKNFQGNETIYSYDRSARLIKKEDVGFDGLKRTFCYDYDLKHNLVSETDPQGHSTKYIPTPFGQKAETHQPPVADDEDKLVSFVSKTSFDSAGNPTRSIDPQNFETKRRFNAYGKPISVEHPNGAKEQWTYYLDGALKTHTDAAGIVTEYKRDYLGRVIAKTIFDKDNTILSEETYEFTGRLLTAKIDAEQNKTIYSYDRAGRKIAEECGVEKTSFFYDALGRCHIIQKGDLRIIYQFDLLDRIEEERKEAHQTILRKTIYRYDRADHKIDTTRWVGGEETHEKAEYDSQNRLKWKTDASGAKETISYNDLFQNKFGQTVLQKTHTDPLGLETIETLDTLGKTASLQKSKQKTLRLSEKRYNFRGDPTLQKDTIFAPEAPERQIQIRWKYDTCGRLSQCIEAGTKITQHTYTLRGEKETTTRPDGVILNYRYNGLGHLLSITSSDKTVSHEMQYNKLGHLISSDGIQRTVDPRGRILSETFPAGYLIQNTYNSVGQKIECKIPAANCLIAYSYNGLDLTQVTRKTLDEAELYQHSYLARDLSGNLQESTLPNSLGSIQYQYDPCSRKTSIAAPHYTQKILKTDLLGHIEQMRTQQDISYFTYDDLYQLTSERGPFNHDYQSDSLHCRLKKNREQYQINALNQIISHIEYDLNGNPKRQGQTQYTFDALDRLIRIQTPTLTQQFTYDSQHRRLTATVNQTTQHFLYDGQNEIGALNAALAVQQLRILGHIEHAEIGAAIAVELSGRVYAPIHDLSGNLALLIPFDNAAPLETRFSAFGEELGSALSPWRYSSKRTDPTGLVYYGRRYYQPALGRWLSPDPAGFTDGMNLYAFVGNCPLTHLDEYGLFGSFSNISSEIASYKKTADAYQKLNPRSQLLSPIYPNSRLPTAYYINGMLNTPQSCTDAAKRIGSSIGATRNIIPIFSESWGPVADFISVHKSINDPNYNSPTTRLIEKVIGDHANKIISSGSKERISVYAFSRGTPELGHGIKNLSPAQRSTLDIITCGGVTSLGRDCGHRVINLISEGDWCSLFFHPELKKNRRAYDSWADVFILDQKDGFDQLTGDHFILSKTYQEGIQRYNENLQDRRREQR